MRYSVVFAIAFFVAACSESGSPRDAGMTPEDAAGTRDAAAAPDAETIEDTGVEPIDPNADTPITDRFRSVADAFERERIAFGAPGAALLILEGGEVTFARGFGSKHPDHDDPVHATTLFRIGSCTKMLTAAVLLQLVAAGTVDLDAPITDVIPNFALTYDATWAPSIKVRHVLSHTSAIVDYTVLEVPGEQQLDSALDSYLTGEFGRIAYLMAPSGRMYNYSNPNFYLAGLAIERAGGELYRDAMKRRLFTPLHMDRTLFLGSEVLADGDFAFAKTTDENGQPEVVGADSYDNAWGRPAGFAWSSVRDLAKFLVFLSRGDESILPSEQRMAMQSPQIGTKELGDLISYGFGLTIYDGVFVGNDFYALRMIEHGGAIPGYAADMYYFPSLDLGLVTLASTDGAYFTESVVTAVQTLATLPAPSTAPNLDPDPNVFPSYAGTYQDDFNVGTIHITTTGTTVSIRMPAVDQARVPYSRTLRPTTKDNFILDVQGYPLPVTFILDDGGAPEYFRTRAFVGRRVPTAWRAPRAPILERTRFLERVRSRL